MKSNLSPKSQAMLDKMMKQFNKDAPAIASVVEKIKALKGVTIRKDKAPTFKREGM